MAVAVPLLGSEDDSIEVVLIATGKVGQVVGSMIVKVKRRKEE